MPKWCTIYPKTTSITKDVNGKQIPYFLNILICPKAAKEEEMVNTYLHD